MSNWSLCGIRQKTGLSLAVFPRFCDTTSLLRSDFRQAKQPPLNFAALYRVVSKSALNSLQRLGNSSKIAISENLRRDHLLWPLVTAFLAH